IVLSDVYLRLFFFSSRRRHTRFSRDWSSDVCSSDLPAPKVHHRIRVGGFEDVLVLPRDLLIEINQHLRRAIRLRVIAEQPLTQRSEERRVGKEWSPMTRMRHKLKRQVSSV